MTTTTTETQPLWLGEDDGRISCVRHGGMYLQSAIAARPKAKSHRIPWGKYVLATEQDRQDWLTEVGTPMECEICRWKQRSS